MTSTRERQRAAARARLEKEMAERAGQARKRRQIAGVVGGAGLLLVVAGTVWLRWSAWAVTTRSRHQPPAPALVRVRLDRGARRPAAAADQGRRPAADQRCRRRAPQTMTIDTNLGPITAKIDLAPGAVHRGQLQLPGQQELLRQHQVPPAGHRGHQGAPVRRPERDRQGLAGHRRHRRPDLPLRRGEPADRQAPAVPGGRHRDGQHRQPSSTGSQFFIVYGDSQLDPSYTVLGTVTGGLDMVKQVAAAGDDGAFAPQAGGGHPKKEVLIKTVTMSAAAGLTRHSSTGLDSTGSESAGRSSTSATPAPRPRGAGVADCRPGGPLPDTAPGGPPAGPPFRPGRAGEGAVDVAERAPGRGAAASTGRDGAGADSHPTGERSPMALQQPTVAFLGLGGMGRPMAARTLAARLPTVVWNRRPDPAQGARRAGRRGRRATRPTPSGGRTWWSPW